MAISRMERFRSDHDLKIGLIAMVSLLVLSAILLEILAHIHCWTREFWQGYFPFALLLAPYILFSSDSLTEFLREKISGSLPARFAGPAYLTAVFAASNWMTASFEWENLVRFSLWAFVPAAILSAGPARLERLGVRECAAVLSLWLPIEFGLVRGFNIIFRDDIQIPALAFAAPALGLYMFRGLGDLAGIGYSLRIRAQDAMLAAGGIIFLALTLIPLGTGTGFINFSLLHPSVPDAVKLILGIYFLVALPEELLFRGILQNLLQKTFLFRRGPDAALAVAAAVFGLAHYNNFSPPDWRYVYLAALAGTVYGWVYRKSGKTTVSAMVHTGVNFFWAILFKDTQG